jgi:hypothetical protein
MRATHNNRRHTFVSCGASLCLLLAATAHAQTQTTLLDQVHTVASADTGIPVENDFDVSVPGGYQIQLTDLGKSVGAAVASVSLALTSGDALVGTPLTGEGTLSFTATAAGSYRVHIVGAPKLNSGGDPLPGSGLISVQISATSAGAPVGAPIFSITENLALPIQSVPGSVGYLQDSLTVTAQTAGAYQLAIADLGWPATLASPPTLLFVPPAGGSPVILPDPNTHALQTTVLLNAGSTYQIYALGQVALNATAGLYSVSLMPTTGAALYSKAVPVGDATHWAPCCSAAPQRRLRRPTLPFPCNLPT